MSKKQKPAATAAAEHAAPTTAPQPHTDWFARLAANKQYLAVALLVGLAVWLVYGQTLRFAFLLFEDSRIVTANRVVQAGWTWPGLQYAFQTYQDGAFYPLAWLSHMTDMVFMGPSAGSHHFTNVFIHLLNSLLLYWILASHTGARWRSGLAALLFAVHPLQVESVAWLAERKTVLGAFFALATMAAWLRSLGGRPRWFAAACILYICAILSNPPVALIALVLPLLDNWLGARPPRWSRALPLLAIGLAVLIFWAVTAERALNVGMNFGARLANAIAAIGEYLATVAWPASLAVPYLERTAVPAPLVAAGAAALVVFTAIALWQRHARPYLLLGWLWFLVSVVPLLGIYPAFPQSRADHTVYLALAGLFIALVWGIHSIIGTLQTSIAVPLAAGLAVLVLTWSAWVQTGYWQNDLALFDHTLKVTGPNRVAHAQIGQVFMQADRTEYAFNHLKAALDLDPNNPTSYRQLAEAYFSRSAYDPALNLLDKAITLQPNEPRIHLERGKVLRAIQRNDEAYNAFEKSIELGITADGRMDAYFNQGRIRDTQLRYAEAIDRYKLALDIEPYHYLARKNLAFALMHADRYAEAAAEFNLLAKTNDQDKDVTNAMNFLRQRIHK